MLRSMDVTYALTDPSEVPLSWLYVSLLMVPVLKLSSVLARFGSPVLLKVTLSVLVGANPVPVQLPALLHRLSPPRPDHTTSARAAWELSRATTAADNIKAFFRFVAT